MTSYFTTNGEVVRKPVIDNRIAKAKDLYSENFKDVHSYIFCERHKRNDCRHIARSHIISVQEAQNSGRAELAYCLDNLEHLCDNAHNEIESFGKLKRESWYHARKKRIDFDEFIKNYKE